MLFVLSILYYILLLFSFLFFFNDTATTEIHTLSLHDALPIFIRAGGAQHRRLDRIQAVGPQHPVPQPAGGMDEVGVEFDRSEEHTSERQSRLHLVCRLLLEKKKKKKTATCPQQYSREAMTPHD